LTRVPDFRDTEGKHGIAMSKGLNQPFMAVLISLDIRQPYRNLLESLGAWPLLLERKF
jgi:hypothetical protein